MRQCSLSDCNNPYSAKGLCRSHYVMLRRRGTTDPPTAKFGAANSNWRGGRSEKRQYIYVWVSPESSFSSMGRQVGEHRLVMAHYLGRPLSSRETVHHINGDPKDNRLENLQLRTGAHGPGQRWRCQDCGSNNVAPEEL